MEIKDVHHIFMKFRELREKASKDVMDAMSLILAKESMEVQIKEEIQNRAKYLFLDSECCWPLHHSQYYLGQVPKVMDQISRSKMSLIKQEKLAHNIHSNWHTAAIRLVGRITQVTLYLILSSPVLTCTVGLSRTQVVNWALNHLPNDWTGFVSMSKNSKKFSIHLLHPTIIVCSNGI